MQPTSIGSSRIRTRAPGFVRVTLATALAIWATHSLNARAETSLAQQRSVAQVAPELKQPLPLIAPATASQALPDSQLLGHILERKKQFAKIDALAEHGQLTELPPPSESIIGDAGGLRSDLAEHGIGFNILSMSTFTNNYKHHDRHRPQAYIGERPTYSSNLVAGFTYDLGRLGLDNGQFIFGVGSYYSSWDEVNPSSPFNFTRIAYYQSLWDKTVEIKIGVLPNDLEYIGPFTGGTLVGGTQGLQAVIPYQVGLSHAPVSSPAANLTLNLGNFYNKFGVQRSISPDGMGAEIDRHLGELDLHADHAGALYIDELGYKRAATPGTPYAWLRAGYIYNTSDYTRFLSNERSDDNHAGYLLGDYQFHQFDSAIASRGLYAGFTWMSAPQDRNLFDLYYGLRLFAKGPLDSRPFDMLTLEYGYTSYSDDANTKLDRLHVSNADDSRSTTLAYNMRLAAGTYFRTGLSYVEKPAFSPDVKDALNLQASLTLFF
ncbi:carbohydrate porin [Pseudomonas citronellolis]|uniref:Carbohydrate porin n=1 Tax=Pseudomonas citronellolis TaxID=53408 RepID=A0AAW6P9S1_9PSED|nr:carbohydrate porin [Pseudomonas citronellolis]MDF3843469.1 carbohydrate porin [Pseudomonas citronellolis]